MKYKTLVLNIGLIIVWLLVLILLISKFIDLDNRISVINQRDSEISNTLTNEYMYYWQNNLNQGYMGIDFNGIYNNSLLSLDYDLALFPLYTSSGRLSVKYNENSFSLYLNNKYLTQLNSSKILYKFELTPAQLVLIFAPEIIGENYLYSLLVISPEGYVIIRDIGNLAKLYSVNLNSVNGCLDLRFKDNRIYADDGDYQLYTYCGGEKLNKVLDMKSNFYYQEKFSKLTARDVYHAAMRNHCVVNDQFIDTPECKNGVKYCYMFKFAKKQGVEAVKKLKRLCNRQRFLN